VNRPLQNLTLEIGPPTAELTHILACDPTVAEVARHMNVSEEPVRYSQVCAASRLPVPLGMPIDDRGYRVLGDLIGRRDEAIEVLPDRLAITELLHVLLARIQRIIALRFYSDLIQTQIAEEIGISQIHVSRLLRLARAWLRAAMLSDVIPRVDRPGAESEPAHPGADQRNQHGDQHRSDRKDRPRQHGPLEATAALGDRAGVA
jgi:RNA polymerase sigma-B factor